VGLRIDRTLLGGRALIWLDVREALDQGELVNDLAALVGDMLLRGLELLFGSVLLEGNLEAVSIHPSSINK
jgi:hypothetical protein